MGLALDISERRGGTIIDGVVPFTGNTWLTWLSHTVDRRSGGGTSYALDLLHCLGNNRAVNAGYLDGDILFEAPAGDGKFLTSVSVALVGTHRVDLGVSTHIPAVVTSKVAMLGGLADVRVTGNEASAGHTALVGPLVADHSAETVELPGL